MSRDKLNKTTVQKLSKLSEETFDKDSISFFNKSGKPRATQLTVAFDNDKHKWEVTYEDYDVTTLSFKGDTHICKYFKTFKGMIKYATELASKEV